MVLGMTHVDLLLTVSGEGRGARLVLLHRLVLRNISHGKVGPSHHSQFGRTFDLLDFPVLAHISSRSQQVKRCIYGSKTGLPTFLIFFVLPPHFVVHLVIWSEKVIASEHW